MSSYVKGTSVERTVFLTLAGTPVTGVIYSSVYVNIKKSGQSAFQAFTTTALNWIGLGGGYYTLIFSAADMNTLGTFAYNATGVGFDNLVFEQFNLVDPDTTGSTQSYFQDAPAERTVYLEKLGSPAAAVLPATVVCGIKKSGGGGFNPNTLTTDNWVNLGNGYYTIKFSASQMSNVGTFLYTLKSTSFDNFNYDEFVILAATDTTVKEKCIVSGQLTNIGGIPSQLIKVSARVVDSPAKFNGKIISADIVYTFLDQEGKFQLPLLRGSVCIIEIPRAAIKHQITVPDTATANLMDLLPPFVNNYSI